MSSKSTTCYQCGTVHWTPTPACLHCRASLNWNEVRTSTFSKKLARQLEIISYIWLLCNAAGLPILVFLLIPLFPVLIPYYVLSFYLFVGYVQHSRGRRVVGGSKGLWGWTIVYQSFSFILQIMLFQSPQFEGHLNIILLPLLWPVVLIILSIIALRLDATA